MIACIVNNKTKIEILGIRAIQSASYDLRHTVMSGPQLWNGAEAIKKKNPKSVIIRIPRTRPCLRALSAVDTEIRLASLSIFLN